MTSFHRAPRQVFTPILTPFGQSGGVDFKMLEQAIHRQVVAGMDGIVVCDSVGEGQSLTQGERDAILWSCVSRGRPHLSVIAATGTNCTRTTIEQCLRAQELGADALLVTIPYYSKPTLKGVVDHFRQIAASVSVPIIVDDDPGRTAIDHGAALLEGLSEFEIIAGVCHGADRLTHFARLTHATRRRFLHLSRDDRMLLQFLELGGNGIVSPISNVIPSPVQTMVSMMENFLEPNHLLGCLAEALAAVGRDDVAALKEAASFIHQYPADVRLPLVPAEPETVIRVRRALAPFARCEASGRIAA